MKKIILISTILLSVKVFAGTNDRFKDGLKLYLSKDSTKYIKSVFTLQNWVRYTDNNPGTTVFGYSQKQTYDMGIRRLRMQLLGKVADRVFVYVQFGMNNFSYVSGRKQGAFFHDAVTEFEVVKDKFSLGTGLTGWAGYSRYSAPSAGTIMALDAPLYQQATNDVTDQFLRKLSIYAKGKLGGFDYRIVMSKPLPVQTSTIAIDTAFKTSATFSPRPAQMQYQGYFMYQFLDKESNLTPYTTGSYLGKKKVFNIGAGGLYQADAMRYLAADGAKLYHPMQFLCADVFYDAPLNTEKGTSITAYAAFFNFDFGKNYFRNLGVMNPTTGVNASGSINGAGNGFPMVGTGNVYYTQVGYKFKNELLKSYGTLQPYATFQMANFQAIKDPVIVYDAGINWLISGHGSKLSLDYQSRPVFYKNSNAEIEEHASARRGMIVLQYQVSF